MPASRTHTFDSGNSLSTIDGDRKKHAKEVAITIALDSLEQRILKEAFYTEGGYPNIGVSQGSGMNSMYKHFHLAGDHQKIGPCRETLAQIAQLNENGFRTKPFLRTPRSYSFKDGKKTLH